MSAIDRIKIFRQISERYLTEWGARQEMFEKFNGTPLYLIKLLTMQRTEYQIDGPLTELARDVLGLGVAADIARPRRGGRARPRTTRRSATSRSSPGSRTSTTATTPPATKEPVAIT